MANRKVSQQNIFDKIQLLESIIKMQHNAMQEIMEIQTKVMSEAQSMLKNCAGSDVLNYDEINDKDRKKTK